MSRRALAPLVLAAALAAGVGCRGRKPRLLVVAGAGATDALFRDWVDAQRARDPGLRIEGWAVDCDGALDAMRGRSVVVAMCGRPLRGEELVAFATAELAREPLAVVVHRDLPRSGLTTATLRALWLGEVASWDQVGGPPLPVVRFTRRGDARAAFESAALHGRPIAAATEVDSDAAVLAGVAATPGAIGYLPLRAAAGAVAPLALDGVAPSVEAVAAGRYRLVRPILLVMWRLPKRGVTREFVALIGGEAGGKIALAHGFAPGRGPFREDPVADELKRALGTWQQGGDPQSLRRRIDAALAAQGK